MANSVFSNVNLKKRNAKIFKRIENKLSSGDEEAFIAAAGKLTGFVSRKEAYYPEARPTIVNICKVARASLSRLAKSDIPFSCSQTVPHELVPRAAAYARLIETVLQFVSTFEGDDVLVRNDLKELFRSATRAPPQPSDLEMKEQEEVEFPQQNTIVNEMHDVAEASRNVSRVSPPFASSEPSSDQLKETTVCNPGLGLISGTEGPKDDSSEMALPPPQTVSAHSSLIQTREVQGTPPTLLKAIDRTISATASQTREPSVDTPMIPVSPSVTSRHSAAETATLPGKSKSTKTPVKSKKIKLKRAAPVDASLIEADLNWHSSKKLEVPTFPDLADNEGDVNMNSSSMPLKQENRGLERSNDVQRAARENAVDVDHETASASKMREQNDESRMITTEVKESFEMQAVEQDGPAQSRPPPVTSEHAKTGSPAPGLKPAENMSSTSAFNNLPISFVSAESGRDDSGTLSLRHALTSEQRGFLSTWQTRDQHECDVSRTLCVSLASYNAADVKSRNANLKSTLLAKALRDLTPSWPTNSRFSADIGSYRLFLAPPLVITGEGFVDISKHVKEDSIEVTLDQCGDMSGYVFAVVVHPPTPSQLRELDDTRAKMRKFRATLDSLRITTIDLVG